MRVSDKGIELLKELEGWRAKAYLDSVGKLTIGWGHVIVPGDGITPDDTIDKVKGTSLLKRDLNWAEMCVTRNVPDNISQNQFDALVLFTYNVGCAAYNSSTLYRFIHQSDFDAAAKEFPRWNKGRVDGKLVEIKGLTNRRAKEQDLFNTKENEA